MLQLYKNIKERRTELHLTQSELADKMGYADKSMIAKIEKGLVDLPQSKIIAFAKALETTPSYLMGWEPVTDEDIGNILSNDNLFETIEKISSLSPSEKNHFIKYLRLFEINRKKADNYIDQLLSLQNMENELIAAHERTDIDIPEGIDTSDDDIMDDENF